MYGGSDMNINTAEEQLPWLIFEIKGQSYAINSSFITEILMKPDEITPLPEAPDIYTGMIERRGMVYPIITMRKVFRFQSVEEECDEFDQMLELRKNDISKWYGDFKKALDAQDRSGFVSSCRDCAFGKWFYSYINANRTEGLLMRHIDEPHRLLHETAEKAFNNNADKSKLLNIAENGYIPQIFKLIDDVKKTRRSSYRQTVIVISDNSENTVGLLVDKVIAVDVICKIDGSRDMTSLLQSKYFRGVAHNDRVKGDILIVDADSLLQYSDVEKNKA